MGDSGRRESETPVVTADDDTPLATVRPTHERRVELTKTKAGGDDTLPGAAVASGGLSGTFAGRYEIKRQIGTGGMGTVYEAVDLNLHRLVALKLLRLAPEQPDERAESVNRLLREARAMAVLSHKNVVAVYDVGFHETQVFVAMQLVDGVTLREWRQAEPRTPAQILRVLHDAGTGLAAAHAARLVHRDFKPDNILVSKGGTARVTDFGLARRTDLAAENPLTTTARQSAPKVVEMDQSSTVTRTGAIVGTPAYMPPEQTQGDPCDARADQFSFCVTAWEALYGYRPFSGDSWSEIYANVIAERLIDPPRSSKIPRVVQRALRRGLMVDPVMRFPSMTAMLEVFERAIDRPARIRKLVIGAISAAVVIGAVTVAAMPRGEGETPAAVAPPTVEPPARPSVPAPTPAPAVVAAPTPPQVVTPAPAVTTIAPTTQTPRPLPRALDRKSDPKPMVAAVPPDPKPAPVEPTPTIDPRLAELSAERRRIDGEWRGRALLASDLPATYATAVRAADTALATGDAAAAETALGQMRSAIASVVIDRGFIDRKLQRVNAQNQRIPAARMAAYQKLWREFQTLVDNKDYMGANRKLNDIVGRLGAS